MQEITTAGKLASVSFEQVRGSYSSADPLTDNNRNISVYYNSARNTLQRLHGTRVPEVLGLLLTRVTVSYPIPSHSSILNC